MSRSRPSKLDRGQPGGKFLHRQIGERRNGQITKQHVTRHRVETLARALLADDVLLQ